MQAIVINSKEDLAAVKGTPEYDVFMAYLAGTIYRLDRDDANKTWVAVKDTTTIARFGFKDTDFPTAAAPALPAYDDSDLYAEAMASIDVSFSDAVAKGVAVTQGFTMQTNWTDGAKIKASYDLAKQLGALDTDASEVRDIANVTHACTVADLLSISAQIGTNYLALLKKKWGYIDQINASTTGVAAQAVVWV